MKCKIFFGNLLRFFLLLLIEVSEELKYKYALVEMYGLDCLSICTTILQVRHRVSQHRCISRGDECFQNCINREWKIALMPVMKECIMVLLPVTESVWDPSTSLAERNHPELGADHLPPVCGEAHPRNCTTHPTVSHQGQGHTGNKERFFLSLILLKSQTKCHNFLH